MRTIVAVAAVIAVALVLAAPHAAGGPEDVANDIARDVMSPYCPGVTLHDCPSDAAADLRQRIEQWVRMGWSRQKVMSRLEAEFGPVIRAVPPAEGSGLLAWILPGLAVVIGVGGAWFAARRWSRGRTVAEPGTGPIGTLEERARLESELDALRGASP